MVKPLGVHAKEETVVVAVKVVEVEVVVIQYKRNLPSRSLGCSSFFCVPSTSLTLGREIFFLVKRGFEIKVCRTYHFVHFELTSPPPPRESW